MYRKCLWFSTQIIHFLHKTLRPPPQFFYINWGSRQTGNDLFVNCEWSTNTNTCGSDSQNCKPSSYSVFDACNINVFIGGYGDSQIGGAE